MTSKTLIVGNSHVAALRQGWDASKSASKKHEVSFFATNSTLFRMLEFNASGEFGIHDPSKYKIRHATFIENMFGKLTVDLNEFDTILVVGQNTNEVDYLRQFEHFSIDGFVERAGKPRLSADAFAAFCKGIAKKRLPSRGWWNWEDTKVKWLPVPVPREDAPLDSERYGVWARFAQEGLGKSYLAPYRETVKALYAEVGIEIIAPPATVIAKNGLTKGKFGKDAGRLEGTVTDYSEGDYHHMNTAYGSAILNSILRK